jgi:hypothetical protein
MDQREPPAALVAGLMAVIALAGILLGCARNTPSHQIRPGEVDFPRANPHPTHSFRFEATLPPKIPVRFKLIYTPSIHSDFKPAELPPCHYRTVTGQILPFSVSVPLPLKFEKSDPELGDHYSGTVVVDEYLPGRCQWELAAGMYSLDGDPRHDVPLFHYSRFVGYAKQDPEARNCTRVPSSYRPKRPDIGIAPIVCATTDQTHIVATADRVAELRPVNLDAGYLGWDVTEVGSANRYVDFVFRDSDKPPPSGEVDVTLQPNPAPAGMVYPAEDGTGAGSDRRL